MRRIFASLMLSAALSLTPQAESAPAGPQSPACALLTPEVATAWGREAKHVSDGGPAQSGMSNCSWASDDFANLIVTLMEGETIAMMGGPEKTFDMYLRSFNAGMKVEPEELEGIGEKATLLLEGEGDMQSAVLMILKGERIVTISTSRTSHDAMIAIGKAVAANF